MVHTVCICLIQYTLYHVHILKAKVQVLFAVMDHSPVVTIGVIFKDMLNMSQKRLVGGPSYVKGTDYSSPKLRLVWVSL